MNTINDSLPVLDLAVIHQLQSIDPDNKRNLVQRLVDLYLESAPQIIDEMHQSLTKSDLKQLMHLVHKFKSSNANLGLKRMHALLIYLESETLSTEEQQQTLNQISSELKNALAALEKI